MPQKTQITATESQVSRQFVHFADLALKNHVIVTKNGRARSVILSIDKYHRLIGHSHIAYRAEDTPDIFMKRIDRLIESLPEE